MWIAVLHSVTACLRAPGAATPSVDSGRLVDKRYPGRQCRCWASAGFTQRADCHPHKSIEAYKDQFFLSFLFFFLQIEYSRIEIYRIKLRVLGNTHWMVELMTWWITVDTWERPFLLPEWVEFAEHFPGRNSSSLQVHYSTKLRQNATTRSRTRRHWYRKFLGQSIPLLLNIACLDGWVVLI